MGPEWQIFIPVWNIFYMMLAKRRWDAEDRRREQVRQRQARQAE
jgi:hypothetical protein